MKLWEKFFDARLCFRSTTCFFLSSFVFDRCDPMPKSNEVRASKELPWPLLYLRSPPLAPSSFATLARLNCDQFIAGFCCLLYNCCCLNSTDPRCMSAAWRRPPQPPVPVRFLMKSVPLPSTSCLSLVTLHILRTCCVTFSG